MKRFKYILIAALFFPAMLAMGAEEGLMKIISPVRLPSELGPQLQSEVTSAREILDRFNNDFSYVLWAVDKLPAKDEDIKPWTEACLKAFPGKIIIALDSKLENGVASPNPDKLKILLENIFSSSAKMIHSVVVNFTRLDNLACKGQSDEAIKAVLANTDLVGKASPKTFMWLLMDDDSITTDMIPKWTEALGNRVNGFLLYGSHDWKGMQGGAYAQLLASLNKTGKPVLRGGFRYISPRLRPGIEADLMADYREHIKFYEVWAKKEGYAGYIREIGPAIPSKVSVNMNVLAK